MKRVSALVAAIVLVLTIAGPVSARAFENCTKLHHKYPHGVAKSNRAANDEVDDGYGRPKVSRKVYRQNRDLDANDDGVACEQ